MKKIYKIDILIFILIILINILGRIKAFSDWYTNTVFKLWVDTMGRINSIFPFSVGGILIALGCLFVFAAVLFAIGLIFLRKKTLYIKIIKVYYCVFINVLLYVFMVMTLNCTLPYNAYRMEFGEKTSEDFSAEDLCILRNYLLDKVNTYSGYFECDEDGVSVYPGEDCRTAIKNAMRAEGNEFDRLKGFYPNVKFFLDSDIMYYSGYSGMYYPFSMEAHVSKYMSNTYFPYTVAHEYAHIKGYMYESEANYLAYLALANSEDTFLQYSAYLNAFSYVNNDFYNAVTGLYGKELGRAIYKAQPGLSQRAWEDSYCYKKEAYLLDEKEEGIVSQTFNAVENKAYDSAMQIYKYEPDYNAITLFLLNYYEDVIENAKNH